MATVAAAQRCSVRVRVTPDGQAGRLKLRRPGKWGSSPMRAIRAAIHTLMHELASGGTNDD